MYTSAVPTFLFFLTSLYVVCAAAPPPLATAKDIKFTVTYSSDMLPLGDILYAKATLTNRTQHAVGIDGMDLLVVRAETEGIKEYICGFGEYGGGNGPVTLNPGESLETIRCLDVFGNDYYEDGHFDPFDRDLIGRRVTMSAKRTTLSPAYQDDRNYLEFELTDEQVIRLGEPIITLEAFNTALETGQTQFEPPFVGFRTNQSSYLFRQTYDSHPTGDARRYQLAMLVLARLAPQNSSTQRVAALDVLVNQLLRCDVKQEGPLTTEIQQVLRKCDPIQRDFIRDDWGRLMDDLARTEPVPAMRAKAVKFVDLLDEG